MQDILHDHDQYIPDLAEITSLALNWNHILEPENQFSTCGIVQLYAVGNTAHEYIVACPLPDLPIDQYPIAFYNEQERSLTYISASITTWFPSYLIYQVQQLLSTYWNALQRENDKFYAQLAHSMGEDLDAILQQEIEIREFCALFEFPLQEQTLTTVFRVLREKEQVGHPLWRFAELYSNTERDSYISQYYQLVDEKVEFARWTEFVQHHPIYNRPLFHLFTYDDEHYKDLIDKDKDSVVPAELAYRVFECRMMHDGKGISFARNLLQVAANIIYREGLYTDSPYYSLIEQLACNGVENVALHQGFFESALRWEDRSDTHENDLQEMISYENALYFYEAEDEEFFSKLFERLRSIARTVAPHLYLIYPVGDDTD